MYMYSRMSGYLAVNMYIKVAERAAKIMKEDAEISN